MREDVRSGLRSAERKLRPFRRRHSMGNHEGVLKMERKTSDPKKSLVRRNS